MRASSFRWRHQRTISYSAQYLRQRCKSIFDETERATLDLTNQMTRNVNVQPATISRIRDLLSDQQLVELIGTIAAYNMASRFVVAAGVDPE